jgi:hypothetical protein
MNTLNNYFSLVREKLELLAMNLWITLSSELPTSFTATTATKKIIRKGFKEKTTDNGMDGIHLKIPIFLSRQWGVL